MNNSALMGQLLNAAHLSAGAAQASLEAVTNKSATPTSEAAHQLGIQGDTIGRAISDDLLKAKTVAENYMDRIKVLRRQSRKAAYAYSDAINHQRAMVPNIPSVEHLSR